jgi:hypothetical protein
MMFETTEIPEVELDDVGISVIAYRSYMLRKIMLGKVIAELLKKLEKVVKI